MSKLQQRRAGPTRRALLRGLGAAVGLPYLPSLAGEDLASPERIVFWYVPNGLLEGTAILPGGTRRVWSFGTSLDLLEPYRSRLTVLHELESVSPTAPPEVDPHELLCSAALTGDYIAARRVEGVHGGRSVDQLIADVVGATRFRSLELTSDSAFPCLPGYRCASLEHVSWDDVATPRSREGSPVRLFERLFGSLDGAGDAEAQALRRARRQSVLDFVSDAAALTRRELGAEDRPRLDAWLDGVRAVESRLQGDAGMGVCASAAGLPGLGELAAGSPLDTTGHVRRMHELLALALQCDATRVATYMIANESSQRTYPELGFADTHHFLTHHGGVAWKVDACLAITRWMTARLVEFIDLLASLPDPAGGSLLDHTTVVVLPGMGDPNLHVQWGLTALLVGGPYQTGDLHTLRGRPHADLLLTLLQRWGVPGSTFGADGTRRITELG